MKSSRYNGETLIREFRFIRLTRNLALLRKFYEEMFDWPVIDDWGGGIMFDAGSAVFELILDPQADRANKSSRLAICVPNVWQLFEKVKDKTKIIFPLRDNSWGDTSFRIEDPEEFQITIFSLKK